MDIWIKIRSLFEKQGAEEAAKGVEKVGKETKDAGDKTEEVGTKTRKAFAAINAGAQVSEGSVMGVGHAIHNLAAQFPKLEGFMAPVGLALAAFAAWKHAIDEVKKLHAELAHGLTETHVSSIEGDIRKIITSYEAYSKALQSAEDHRKALSDAESAKDDARLASDLAKLNLEQAEKTLALKPEDSFGKKRLEIEMAAKRSTLTDAAALRKSDRELANIKAEGNDAQLRKDASEDQQKELISIYNQAGVQLQKILEDIQKKSASMLTPYGKQEKYKEESDQYADVIGKLTAIMTTIGKEISKPIEESAEASRKIVLLGEKAEVNRITRDTSVTSSQTVDKTRTLESRQLEYEAQKERERLEKELRERSERIREEERRKTELSQNAAKAYGKYIKDVHDEDNSRSGQTPQQEARQRAVIATAKEASDRANEALSAMGETIKAHLIEQRAEINKIKEQIQNLPK